MKIAVIFVNIGPYHVARALALMAVPGIQSVFIELAPAQAKYPWKTDKRVLGAAIRTLMPLPVESYRRREIIRPMFNTLEDLKPDVVAIAGYDDAVMRRAAVWARRNDRGVILMSDTTAWDCPRKWWKEALKRQWIERYVDGAFVAGTPHRDYVQSLGVPAERIRLHCDVVDNDFYAGQVERVRNRAIRSGLKLPQRYFLFVGRLSPEKNVRTLLVAYQKFTREKGSALGLVVVGEGPQREELHTFAAQLGLSSIIWPGFVQAMDLSSYYAFAECLILPSSKEPWGLVVNEAMAAGLPIIVSRACGCSVDLVQEEINGYTFDPSSADDLRAKMSAFAGLGADDRSAMGNASRRKVADWSPAKWGEELAALAEITLDGRVRSQSNLYSPYRSL